MQPYYNEHIWPYVAAGKNVIIAAHGNSLRALIMYLEKLSEQEDPRSRACHGRAAALSADRDRRRRGA